MYSMQLTLSSLAATQTGTCLQDNFRSREIYGSPSSSGGRLHAIYASLIASQSGGVLNPILCAVHLTSISKRLSDYVARILREFLKPGSPLCSPQIL